MSTHEAAAAPLRSGRQVQDELIHGDVDLVPAPEQLGLHEEDIARLHDLLSLPWP